MSSQTTANVNDISIHFVARLPNEDEHLKLEKFEIHNIGGIVVDFNGQNFGFLNWIISQLSSSIINSVKGIKIFLEANQQFGIQVQQKKINL